MMSNKDYFYQSFLTLKNEEEVKRYLRDLLTSAEIEELSERLWIARLLVEQNKYEDIVRQTSASSRTIARVSKWLKTGSKGYKLVISRMHHNQSPSSHL